MLYLLLIYVDEKEGPQPGSPEYQELLKSYGEYTRVVQGAGVFNGSHPLEAANTAKTVRVRDGKSEIRDGPFAETKEILGGYYLLDCKDFDEALKYAAQVPDAKYGSIEVRPIMVFSNE